MFSVVIPLYNKEKSIGDTIQSILNQTFTTFEIIVVNDGSTDNSLKLVKDFKDSRVKIIDKPNGGVSSARNRGIKEAKYDWIGFLDGDDLWEQDKLQICYDELLNFPNVSWIVTAFSTNRNFKRINYIYKNQSQVLTNIFDSLNTGLLIHTSAVLVRKSMFIERPDLYFTEGINNSEDREVWYKLSCLSKSPLYIAKSLSTYIVDVNDSNSLTRNKNEISNMHFLSMKDRLVGFVDMLDRSDRVKLFDYIDKFNKRAILNLWCDKKASEKLIEKVGLNSNILRKVDWFPKIIKKIIIKLCY